RTTYTSGSLNSGKSLGHGTISFKLVDETDGNLANNQADPVRIYGYGQVNSAVKICSVQLSPANPALSCLLNAVDSVGTLSLSTLYASGAGTLSSNAQVAGSGTLNTIALESVGTVNFTGSGTGARSPNAAVRNFPDASSVFSQYTASAMGGSTITFALLPMG